MVRGDIIQIERADGYSRYGKFIKSDDEYVIIRGTVGDDIGKEMLIPKAHIVQITIIQKVGRDENA
jgi:hypothetical protein